MNVTVEWIDVRERLPHDGAGVIAAVAGRYRFDPCEPTGPLSGQEFWLVLPMYFRHLHPVEETGEVVVDCFVDADYVVRLPLGGATHEVVTHWAEMPNLPGTDVTRIIGDGAHSALRAVSDY